MKISLGLIVMLATLGLATVCFTAEASGKTDTNGTIKLNPTSKESHQIRIGEIKRRAITGLIGTTAIVEPDVLKLVHVTPRIRARVERLVAEPGQLLKPGDTIAILSSIELGTAKADYLKARSLEQISAQNLQREERLFKDKIASAKDVLDARANHETMLAEYQTARETLALLIPPSQIDQLNWSTGKKSLSEFALTSPIKGTLVKRNLTVGTIVNGEDEVATVIDLDTVWVLANIYEHDLSMVRTGATATISVDAYPNQKFSGVVAYVGDTVDRTTRTVQARIDVANPEHLLKPGMFARAEITGGSGNREVLAAPSSAVFDVNGSKAVFVETGTDTFKLTPVELGEAGQDAVEVLSGVTAGDKVVTRGGLLLKALLVNGATD